MIEDVVFMTRFPDAYKKKRDEDVLEYPLIRNKPKYERMNSFLEWVLLILITVYMFYLIGLTLEETD